MLLSLTLHVQQKLIPVTFANLTQMEINLPCNPANIKFPRNDNSVPFYQNPRFNWEEGRG
jgi:hypothetical protein